MSKKYAQYKGNRVEVTDCTPTWEAVLPILLASLTVDKGSKSNAITELTRMAKTADKYNEMIRKINKTIDK